MTERLLEKLDFLEDNHRHKALFLLLFRNNDYTTSSELAKKLNVSDRTIKSDIKYISEKLNIDGVEIVSQRSRGTMIEVNDPQLKFRIKEYFKIYQEHNIDNSFDQNVHYILRRLLVSKIPVRIERLQEELYLNTSNYINREIQEVKKILTNYKLKLVTKVKEGLIVEGNSYDKYLCMLKMYKYFSDSIDPEFKNQEFSDLFKPRFAKKQEIKAVICKSLLDTRIVFSDIYLERFVIYIILLSNVYLDESLEGETIINSSFDYTITDEYQLVLKIDQELRNQFTAYPFRSVQVIKHLTYLAIMSTDLYRIRDCTEEKYGTLIPLAEEIRHYIVQQFETSFKVCISDDIVFLKDLLKILIPISMKIKLGISDDVDLGFYNVDTMNLKPVIKEYVHILSANIHNKYNYQLSFREEHLLLNVIYEFINNIQLSHKKMKIAIIAIDGRLSTQQLKFCMRKYFSSYIERIETRVLYELNEIDTSVYDCFFCMDFGKNINIPFAPVYYFKEGMSDDDYRKKLQEVFLSSYYYSLFLPQINYTKIRNFYALEEYPISNYLIQNNDYMKIIIGNEKDIDIYICLESEKESIDFHYYENEGISINGKLCYILINLNISYNKQKFKMLLNVINKMAEEPELVKKMYKQQEIYIESLLKK